MAVRAIVMHPDPRLRVVCAEVRNADVRDLARDMLDTMYDAGGRGLAAPQIGESCRVFVYDASWKTGTAAPVVCVNPVVEPLGPAMVSGEELCLSIPDRPITVTRPSRVRMRWQTIDGVHREAELDGDAAIIVQHEADHLDGRLIVDISE